MKSRMQMILIIDVLLVILTTIIFICTSKQLQLLDWLTRIFIVITEILAGAGIAAIDFSAQQRGGLFTRSGSFSTILITALLSVLTSVYFMTVGGRPEIFITLQVILLGDGLIMVLVILYKGPCAAECNLNTEEVRAKMQKLEEQVLAMVDNPNNHRYAEKLRKIAEDIRYSDNSAATSWDYKLNEDLAIVKGMLEVSEMIEEIKIQQKIDELQWILDQRKQTMKRLKAGII